VLSSRHEYVAFLFAVQGIFTGLATLVGLLGFQYTRRRRNRWVGKPTLPFLKSAQSGFESQWGHGKRLGRRVIGANGSVDRPRRRGVVAARGGMPAERSTR
jgi:hypothetical protein